jgi:hypothetical protein
MCSLVSFWGGCGSQGVTVGIKAYALDSWQFEDKFDTLAHIGRVWVQVSLIYISVFEVQMTIIHHSLFLYGDVVSCLWLNA